MRPNGEAPLGSFSSRGPIADSCRRARVRQGQAFGGAEEAPSLTATARDGKRHDAVGTEECSRRGSNKECRSRKDRENELTTLTNEAPYKACSGFTRVTARRIAQPPKATFVARLRPGQLPDQAARQLPDLSTIIRVEPSSTDDSRLRGALPEPELKDGGCLCIDRLGNPEAVSRRVLRGVRKRVVPAYRASQAL